MVIYRIGAIFFDKKMTKMMMTVKMLTIKGTVDEPYAMRREI